MTLMKMEHVENSWNLERQRRQFLEEENKKLRAEIAVAENVRKRLFCQDEESGKCNNYVLCSQASQTHYSRYRSKIFIYLCTRI